MSATNPTPSSTARLRAGAARLLAALAGGARRVEAWSVRGGRPLVVGLVILAVAAVAIIGIGAQERGAAGWFDGAGHHAGPPRPAQKPAGKPVGKPEAKPHGGYAAKPVAPVAPAPPVPGDARGAPGS